MTIKVVPSPNLPLPAGYRLCGEVFDLQAYDQSNNPVLVFTHEFILTIGCGAVRASSLQAQPLSLQYWGQAANQWENIPAEMKDKDQTLTASFNRPGSFALLEADAIINRWVYLPMIAR
jgi:hypothetical protein